MDQLVKIRDFLTSRWFVKGAFLAFFVWSCWRLLQFAAWARGEGAYVPRPETVAGILPIGHFTSFFAWLRGGGWDSYLPAGLVIIIAAIATSLLLKRGFCGWICPVGTVWEAASAIGRRIFGRNFVLWRPLDIALRGLRYVITAAAVGFLFMVPLSEAVGFRTLPYMWVADIKILGLMGHAPFLGIAALTFGVSALIGPVWCRYLCPLGGLYSLFGMASPCSVRRDEDSCTHCHRCTRTCHAFIEVEAQAGRLRSAECDGCMDCVKACPVDDCLTAEAPSRIRIQPWAWPLLVLGLWFSIHVIAVMLGAWHTTVPVESFQQIVRSGLLEMQTGVSP
jgi:polyferredoxin